MFRLRKIIGSRTNVPEIHTLPADTDSVHKENCVEYLVNGKLNPVNIENKGARYVCLESCQIPSKPNLPAYKITPDMVFEADFNGDPAAIVLGGKYSTDTSGTVTSTPGEEVVILDSREAESKGTVMVSFIC